jgi:hypothetical protein
LDTEYKEALIALAVIVLMTVVAFALAQIGHTPQNIGLM